MSDRSHQGSTCEACDQPFVNVADVVKCFVCKADTHLACTGVKRNSTSIVSQLVKDGSLYYVCRICKTNIKSAVAAHRAKTNDEYMITLTNEMDKTVKEASDS